MAEESTSKTSDSSRPDKGSMDAQTRPGSKTMNAKTISQDAGQAVHSRNGRGSKRRIKALALIAMALVIAAVAVFAFASSQIRPTITTSWGDELYSDLSSVSVQDKTITQDDLKSFCTIKPLYSLSLRECDLSQCEFSSASSALNELRTLDLSGSTGISGFRFLSDLTLSNLNLSGVLEKEAPLAGRVSILLVRVYQPTAERCSSDAWNDVSKAAK